MGWWFQLKGHCSPTSRMGQSHWLMGIDSNDDSRFLSSCGGTSAYLPCFFFDLDAMVAAAAVLRPSHRVSRGPRRACCAAVAAAVGQRKSHSTPPLNKVCDHLGSSRHFSREPINLHTQHKAVGIKPFENKLHSALCCNLGGKNLITGERRHLAQRLSLI